jgi:hypothetical protein
MFRDPRTRRNLFRMNVEQRVIIKFLRFKRMKLVDIHYELTIAFSEEVYTLTSVRYLIHELKIGRAILTDETRPGKHSIYHIDALILK